MKVAILFRLGRTARLKKLPVTPPAFCKAAGFETWHNPRASLADVQAFAPRPSWR